MFLLDGSGVLTWEELGFFFDILQFPQVPLNKIKEWAGLGQAPASGVSYDQWKNLLHSHAFKKFAYTCCFSCFLYVATFSWYVFNFFKNPNSFVEGGSDVFQVGKLRALESALNLVATQNIRHDTYL